MTRFDVSLLRSTVVTATILGVSICEAKAQGTNVPTSWDDWFAFDMHFATLHGPHGYLGVSAELTPIRYLGLEVGFGKGDPNLVRGAAMLHARLPFGRVLTFTGGAGFSLGKYVFDPNCPNEAGAFVLPRSCRADIKFGRTDWDLAYFRNVEVGVEGRTGSGFHFRAMIGSSAMLNRGAGKCVTPPCPPSEGEPSESHAYFDLAIGVSFL